MSIKELKKQEKEQRRNYIVDVAERLFFSGGYDSVSMEDIGREVGFNKATLYLYFKNKEALFFAVALRGARLMDEAYAEGAKQGPDGLSRLLGMRLGFFKFAREHPEYFKMVCYTRSEKLLNSDSEDAKAIFRLTGKNMELIVKTIEEGIQDGSIRSDLSPTEIALYLGLSNLSVLNPDPAWKMLLAAKGISYDQFVDDFHRFITPAIISCPGPESGRKGCGKGRRLP